MARCSFLLAVVGIAGMAGMAVSGVAGADCSGYSCLKEYVEREDGAYSWTDTGHRLVVDPSRWHLDHAEGGQPWFKLGLGSMQCILTKSLQCSLGFNCVTLTLVFPAVFPH